jgi:hypothetical protein
MKLDSYSLAATKLESGHWAEAAGLMSVAFLLCISSWSRTARADEVIPPPGDHPIANVRPMFGFGYSNTYGSGPSGWGYQAGGRAQLYADASQSFGLEASYVVPVMTRTDGRYVALGLVLEQRLWDAFIMSIGTVGYLGVSGQERQPFGIVTNLGYSPRLTAHLRPFLTYRAEWIFASPAVGINSLSVGLTVNF